MSLASENLVILLIDILKLESEKDVDDCSIYPFGKGIETWSAIVIIISSNIPSVLLDGKVTLLTTEKPLIGFLKIKSNAPLLPEALPV